MKLSYVNNVLIFIVLIILSKLAYNIFMNKKNVESFINRWSLNSHGQLCHNNGNCKNIAVLDTNSNRICSIGSDTLNCNDITSTPSTPSTTTSPPTTTPSTTSTTTSPPTTTPSTTSTTTTTTTTPADGGGGANCSSAQVDGLTISSDNVVSTTDEISGITISNIIGESNTGLTTIFPAILRNLVGGNYIGFDVTFSGQTYTGELLSITDINEGAYIQTSDPTGTIVKTYNVSKNEDNCYIITQI